MQNETHHDEMTGIKKNPLCEVTPVSKVLSAIVFISLPFFGFWLGTQYQTEPTQAPIIITSSAPVEKPLEDTEQGELRDILFNDQKTGYTTDGNLVYFSEPEGNNGTEWILAKERTIVADADASTFKVIASEPAQIGTLFAVDKNAVYARAQRLPNVDPRTITLFGKGDAFLASNAGLYRLDSLISEIHMDNLEVFAVNVSEGFNVFNVYIHDTSTEKWYEQTSYEGILAKEIAKPAPEAIGGRMYP